MRPDPEAADVQCQLGVRVGDWGRNAPYLRAALPEPKNCVSSAGVFYDTLVHA